MVKNIDSACDHIYIYRNRYSEEDEFNSYEDESNTCEPDTEEEDDTDTEGKSGYDNKTVDSSNWIASDPRPPVSATILILIFFKIFLAISIFLKFVLAILISIQILIFVKIFLVISIAILVFFQHIGPLFCQKSPATSRPKTMKLTENLR